MELSINEKKYLKKVIKKYPKKKIYKLIKKKDNLEISNDLKSLLTKMENVNFMDNYYEDMIGGMNSVLNMIRQQRQPQQPQQPQPQPQPPQPPQGPQGPQAPQQKSLWPSLSNLSIPKVPAFASAQRGINQRIQSTRRDAASIAPEVENSLTNVQRNITKGVQRFTANIAPEVENRLPNVQRSINQGIQSTQAGIVNTQRNVTEGAASLSSSLSELKSYMDNPNLLQNLIDKAQNIVQGKVGEFVLKIQKNMVKLSANLNYDEPNVSFAVETYLLTLGIPSPFNKLFGRFYFNFVIKPYIQSTLQTYPIHYNEQNLVESPISDMYNNNINSYAPHMYYPINYNSIEKYPMDNYDGYYN